MRRKNKSAKQNSKLRRARNRTYKIEPLEPRIALTGDLCITEFLASNTDSNRDSFGERSDWIELFNNSEASIDLGQFHLTDDATDLRKFALPDTTILPGESILVWASGRDVTTASGEIHANFSLSAAGEYLALTTANGTVVQDFGESYPEQFENISFGVEMFNESAPFSIIAESATAQLLIPNAATGPALGLSWIESNFNDASWSNATLPIGYENSFFGYNGLINTSVPSGTTSSYLRIPFNLDSLSVTSDLTLNVRYDDGFVAYLNGEPIADDRAPTNPTWDSTATSNHNDTLAAAFQSFDVSAAQPLLRTGENVLAIHALNVNDTSSDYLFEATLEGSASGIPSPANVGYLEDVTPGSGNGVAFDGFVQEVEFSLDHGFFDETQTLELTSPSSNATIVYTTDGSDPTVSNNLSPTNGSIYTSPISISETTIVRAAAFEAGQSPSFSRARTYIFTADVIGQSPNNETPEGFPSNAETDVTLDYGIDQSFIATHGQEAVENALQSISTISIATDIDNLFDPDFGIYENPQNRGSNWERFTSVELIEPDGSEGFQANAGLRIRGGFSRNDRFPKRSLRLFFRGDYGDSKLEYDFFGGDGAEEFDVLDLRTSQNYSWANGDDDRNTFLREVFGRDTQGDLGHLHTRSRYHHLYLNGIYWGLYQTQERVQADFGESYLGGDDEDYDRVKNNNANGHRTEAADGNDEDWERLFTLAQELADDPIRNANHYWTMQGLNPDGTRNPSLPVLLDVDNLIDYETILFLTGGFDSGISNFLGNDRANNWVAIRNRETDDHGFQFFIHDNEHSLGVSSNSNDRTGPYFSSNDSDFTYFNPGFLHQDLLDHPEYQLRFADRVQKHFFNDGALTFENNLERLEAREADVSTAILAEAARWGDTHTGRFPLSPTTWQGAVDDVKDWLSTRNNTVLSQLRNDDLHSTIAPAVLNQHGGAVAPGFAATLSTTARNSTIYYTTDGTDPRLPGGAISDSAIAYNGSIPISTTTTVFARVQLSNGDWSAATETDFRPSAAAADATNLRVTELNYHPADPTASELDAIPTVTANSFEFIEFQNVHNSDIDLTGVEITSPVPFVFPAITVSAGESFVVARNQLAFGQRYPGIETVGEYGEANGFGNGGDTVTIAAADGNLIQSFTYDDSGDWPSLADGNGHSLEIVSTDGDYNDPLNWLPSRSESGSPGSDDAPGTSTSGLRITELNYNPADGGAEFIELANTSSQPIDVSGFRFVEGVTFDFSTATTTTLQPNQVVLVANDINDFEDAYGPALPVIGQFEAGSLSNGGERIILFDANGSVIHDFVYDDASPWATSADGNGDSLRIISTDGNYSSATNWQGSGIDGGTPGVADSDGPIICDYVGDNGCDISDLEALYAGTNGAPTPVTNEIISQWLIAASADSNPAKDQPDDVYVFGDVNLDGDVNSTDLGILLNSFSDTGAGWASGNLNGDQVVDSADLGLLLNNFGHTSVTVAATVEQISPAELHDETEVDASTDYSIRDLVFGDLADDDE